MVSIALLSDIHGNLPAFAAVTADIAQRRPDAVCVLGDMINGCPWSAEVLDRLLALGWPMLLGNHDDAVLQLDTPRMEARYHDRPRYAALWWTREQLAGRHLAALSALPLEKTLTFPDVLPLRLLHGLPGNFFAGFRPDSPAGWAARQLASVAEGTVAGGHTHVAMARRIPKPDGGGWLVVNSGSAGVSYDGDPRASYVWLESDTKGWRADIRRVDYDRCCARTRATDDRASRPRVACWARCSCAPRSPGSRGSPISCGGCGSSSATSRPTWSRRNSATMPATVPAAGPFRWRREDCVGVGFSTTPGEVGLNDILAIESRKV